MKKSLLLFALMAITVLAGAQQKVWNNDAQHSRLGFTVKHLMISQVSGRFTDFKAVVHTTKSDYSDAKVTLTAKVASINTDVEARDNHLRSADFFDAEKYPTLTFTSTSIKKVGAKKGVMFGRLTFHGVTKNIKLNVIFFGMTTNPMNKKLTAGFRVMGTLKRTDFALGPKYPSAMISNEVNITGDVEFSPEK